MANALASAPAMPPPAPSPQPLSGGSALAPSPQMPQGGMPPGAGAAAPPAPSHAQTAAALRHFQAIGKELQGLLVNPDIGRSDIRPAIIDSVTRLVAERIISPAQAVTQLGNVPDKPFDQKKSIEAMFSQTMQAEVAILDHHGASNPPQSEDFATENAANAPGDPDQHMQMMSGMMQQHYPKAA